MYNRRNILKRELVKGLVATVIFTAGSFLKGCSAEDKKYISDEFTKSAIITRDVAVDMYTGPSRIIIDGTQKILSYDGGDTRVDTEPTKKR